MRDRRRQRRALRREVRREAVGALGLIGVAGAGLSPRVMEILARDVDPTIARHIFEANIEVWLDYESGRLEPLPEPIFDRDVYYGAH